MKVSKKLKMKAKISKLSGFTAFCYFLNRNKKRVIGYHNVIPDNYFDNSIHLEYSHRESIFKKQLEIINNRFQVDLDIEEKGTLTLTFDDGFLNQCTVASKIMDKLNNKGYFFVATNLINSKKTLEIDRLMFWMSYVPLGIYKLNKLDYSLEIDEEWKRSEEWGKLYNMINKSFTFEDLSEILNEAYAFEKIKINKEFYNIRFNGITSDDLEIMRKNGHKIGAHSVTHSILSRINENILEAEIKECSELLGQEYNTKVFAYPYGGRADIPKNIDEILKKYSFEKSLAYGNSKIKEGYDNYYIPRIILPDTDDKNVIDFILSGAINMISYKSLLPGWGKK